MYSAKDTGDPFLRYGVPIRIRTDERHGKTEARCHFYRFFNEIPAATFVC